MEKYNTTDDFLDEDDIPNFDLPTEPGHLAAIGDLRFMLLKWQMGGCNTPFTFSDLVNNSKAGQDVCVLVKRLLGDAIWSTLFPDSLEQSTTIIPRQAGILLLTALNKLQLAELEAQKAELKAQAEVAYHDLEREAKKRRLDAQD